MPAITRRGWQDIRTEAIRRLKGITATTFEDRVEHWIYQAYLQLATTYHHHELDRSTTLVLSTSTNAVNLPSDCYIACSASLRNVLGTDILAQLTFQNPLVLRRAYRLDSGQPERWSRWANQLIVDKLPDQTYRVDFDYYALPAAPDFGTSSLPETGVDCDEAIIQWALALAKPEISVPTIERDLLTAWLGMQPRPSTLDDLTDLKERQNTSRPRGGAQG